MALTSVRDALLDTLERAGVRPDNEARTLVMLSGGPRSTSLLAALLEHTSHQVHAHHIERTRPEGDGRAEVRAVRRVAAWCERHARSFELSDSADEHLFPSDRGAETTATMFVAARVCYALRNQVQLVLTGHVRPAFAVLAEAEAVFHAAFIHRPHRPIWARPLASLPGDDAELAGIVQGSVAPDLLAEVSRGA